MRAALLLTTTLFLAPVSADEPKAKGVDKDLQGKWKLKELITKNDGGAKSYLAVTSFERITITADGLKLEYDDDKGARKAVEYTLSTSKDGTTKVFTKVTKDKKGTTEVGIYELDGDTLRMCSQEDGKQPKDFTIKEGQKKYTSVYAREK